VGNRELGIGHWALKRGRGAEGKDLLNFSSPLLPYGVHTSLGKLPHSLFIPATPLGKQSYFIPSNAQKHLCSERKHLCSERKHLCSERKHLCSERKHLCSARKHLCSARKHLCSARKHLCSARKHLCSARKHLCVHRSPYSPAPFFKIFQHQTIYHIAIDKCHFL
jgi:hypothetical protein